MVEVLNLGVIVRGESRDGTLEDVVSRRLVAGLAEGAVSTVTLSNLVQVVQVTLKSGLR